MNRKVINELNNIKLTHELELDRYEVIFGDMNIGFRKFDEAHKVFTKLVVNNKPTLKVRIIRKIWGRNAA